MKGDRVEVVVDVGEGGTRTYDIVATRAGRRVETTTGRGVVEVAEVTRTGQVVRTARFMQARRDRSRRASGRRPVVRRRRDARTATRASPASHWTSSSRSRLSSSAARRCCRRGRARRARCRRHARRTGSRGRRPRRNARSPTSASKSTGSIPGRSGSCSRRCGGAATKSRIVLSLTRADGNNASPRRHSSTRTGSSPSSPT